MSIFCNRLIQLKHQKQLLQKNIASDNNIALRTYQSYEKGESEPNISTLIKLCKYFNVSADYLLGLSDNPEINK